MLPSSIEERTFEMRGHCKKEATCFVSILKIVEVSELQFQLHHNRVAFQKTLHFLMVGFITKFIADNAYDFAIMDGRVQMFQV
jgi:hypothetical protein